MSKHRPLARLSVWLGQTLVGGITELPNDINIFVFDEKQGFHVPQFSHGKQRGFEASQRDVR